MNTKKLLDLTLTSLLTMSALAFLNAQGHNDSTTEFYDSVPLAVQANENEKQVHLVTAGQTLYSIARHYDVNLDELMALNPSNVDKLFPGDILILPQSTTVSVDSAASTKNYGAYLTEDQYQTLLKVVQQEAGGYDYHAILAVMSVITNRVDAGYGDDVYDVITSPGQFESYGANHYLRQTDITDTTIQAVNDGLAGVKNVDTLNFWSDWYAEDKGVFGSNIGGNIFFDI